MPKLVLPEESQTSTPPAVEEAESKVITEPPAEDSPPAGSPEPLDPILMSAVESQPKVKVKHIQVKDKPKTEAAGPNALQPEPTPKKRRGGLPVLLGFAAAAVVGLMAISSLGQKGGEPSGRYQPEQPAYTPTRTSQPRNILD